MAGRLYYNDRKEQTVKAMAGEWEYKARLERELQKARAEVEAFPAALTEARRWRIERYGWWS